MVNLIAVMIYIAASKEYLRRIQLLQLLVQENKKGCFFSEHSNVIGNFIIYTLQHQTRFMAIFL